MASERAWNYHLLFNFFFFFLLFIDGGDNYFQFNCWLFLFIIFNRPNIKHRTHVHHFMCSIEPRTPTRFTGHSNGISAMMHSNIPKHTKSKIIATIIKYLKRPSSTVQRFRLHWQNSHWISYSKLHTHLTFIHCYYYYCSNIKIFNNIIMSDTNTFSNRICFLQCVSYVNEWVFALVYLSAMTK